MNKDMKCPDCQSKKIRKNGHRRGKQNYHSQECGRQFITAYSHVGYPLEVKENRCFDSLSSFYFTIFILTL